MQDRGLQGESACYKEVENVLSRDTGCTCVAGVGGVVSQSLSPDWLFVVLWTIAHQPPLFMEFFRQEDWSGMPFIPLGYLSNPGIEFLSPVSPALAGGFFTIEPPGKPIPGKYFKGLMKIINNMTVGLFLFPAKGAQLGSSKVRELKIIRMKKFLEVIYDVWLSPANFVLNDMPIIYSGGYWLFYPVAIFLPRGNIFYDFLWEATLPHHIIAFAGADSIATQSSL